MTVFSQHYKSLRSEKGKTRIIKTFDFEDLTRNLQIC